MALADTPGRRAYIKAQQALIQAAPVPIIEPAKVVSVAGTAVQVTWRGDTFPAAWADSITGLAAGQTVLLLLTPNGTPFILARPTGTPT